MNAVLVNTSSPPPALLRQEGTKTAPVSAAGKGSISGLNDKWNCREKNRTWRDFQTGEWQFTATPNWDWHLLDDWQTIPLQ